jgi:hypothetical protein
MSHQHSHAGQVVLTDNQGNAIAKPNFAGGHNVPKPMSSYGHVDATTQQHLNQQPSLSSMPPQQQAQIGNQMQQLISN